MSLKQTTWGGVPESWDAFCHILDRTVDKALFDLQIKRNVLLTDMNAWILIRLIGMWVSTAELRDEAEGTMAHRERASKIAGFITIKLAGIVGVRYVHSVFGLIGRTRLSVAKAAAPVSCTLPAWTSYCTLVELAAIDMTSTVANGRLDVSDKPLLPVYFPHLL